MQRTPPYDAGDSPQADKDADTQDDALSADKVGDWRNDDDGRQAGDRDEHVQDAEHPAADVFWQLFLELRLRCDRDDGERKANKVGDKDDQRENRHDPAGLADLGSDVVLQEARDGPGDGKECQQDAKRDHPRLDGAPARQPVSVGVEGDDPGHDAEPQRQHHDHEIL